MTAQILRRRQAGVTATLAVFMLVASRGLAQTYVFAPTQLVDSFDNQAAIDRYLTTGDAVYNAHTATTKGVTRGSGALLLDLEGDFDLDSEELDPLDPVINGWGALSGLGITGDYTAADTAAHAAFEAVAANPEAWQLVFDVTTDADSWVNAPDTVTSTKFAPAVDVGPDRFGVRVQFTYDGVIGGVFNTGSFWNAAGKRTVSIPFSSLVDGNNPLTPGRGTYNLQFGTDNARFSPDPAGGAKIYIDNVRVKPIGPPGAPDVVWNFEDGTLQDWLDTGRTGTDTHHNHHNVTGNGATSVAANGDVTLAPAGKALLIETSPITASENGFQWASSMILNADPDNNGAVEAGQTAIKSKISNIVSRMKVADAIAFDVTFHDSTAPPSGLPAAQFPGEPNAPWIKLVMGIWTDSTPENGPVDGLTQFQYDNQFVTDALGNSIDIARGDFTALYTTEISPDGITPDEPFTMTYPFSNFGNLASALKSSLTFENSNYFEISLAVQTGNGESTILAVIDNIRFLSQIELDADFNHNGEVTGADATVWNGNLGATNGMGDADDNGVADGNDILLWQQQLGNDGTPATAAAGVVPEPATGVMLAAGLGLWNTRRRRS